MRILLLIFVFLFTSIKCFADCSTTIDGHEYCDLEVTDYYGLISAPSVSTVGTARQYFDIPSGKWKCSEDGGAYTNCIGGSGSGATQLTELSDVNTATATAGRILVADGTDFESMAMQGSCTMNGAGFISCTGTSSVQSLTDLTDVNTATVTAGRILLADGTDFESTNLQGSCQLNGAGFLTCGMTYNSPNLYLTNPNDHVGLGTSSPDVGHTLHVVRAGRETSGFPGAVAISYDIGAPSNSSLIWGGLAINAGTFETNVNYTDTIIPFRSHFTHNMTGTIANLIDVGAFSEIGAGGTVTNNFGFYVYPVDIVGAATMTNNYAIYVNSPIGAGSMTNNYGMLIKDQTLATNDYGVAIEGADTQVLWLGSGADNTDASNGIAFGLSRDTNLYRSAANTLKTDDSLDITGTLTAGTVGFGLLALNDVNSSTATAGRILIADGTDFESVAMQGSCTMNGAGFITCSPTGSSAYATIQNEGSSLPQRTIVDFVGGAIDCADSGGIKTQCTITGGGASQLSELSDVNTVTATSGNLLIAGGSQWESVALSGDATVSGTGVLTLANNSLSLVELSDVNTATATAGSLLIADGTTWESVTYKPSTCAVVSDLSSTDDNFPLGTTSTPRTILKVGCRCHGTCSTTANIALEDDSGNAMTHSTPTCATAGTNITYQPVTAAGSLVAGEGLRIDVTNTPSPSGSDEYEVCWQEFNNLSE